MILRRSRKVFFGFSKDVQKIRFVNSCNIDIYLKLRQSAGQLDRKRPWLFCENISLDNLFSDAANILVEKYCLRAFSRRELATEDGQP